MRASMWSVWRSLTTCLGALAALLSLMLASPAAAGGDIGATSGSAQQAQPQLAEGSGSTGWSDPFIIEQGGLKAGANSFLYAKSALGVLRISADGSTAFWSELPQASQSARLRFGPVQLGSRIPETP